MDNPKIIKIEAGTEISNEHTSYKLLRKQNFTVVSETETHFFIRKDKMMFSVRKTAIKYVTYRKRTLKFEELKKEEILNIFENYPKLIQSALRISAEISKLRTEQHDMSRYEWSDIIVSFNSGFISLTKYHQGSIYICHVPLKYLWDHDWKKTLKKDYGSIQ